MGNPVQQPNFTNLLKTVQNIVCAVPHGNKKEHQEGQEGGQEGDYEGDYAKYEGLATASFLREERRLALVALDMITDAALTTPTQEEEEEQQREKDKQEQEQQENTPTMQKIASSYVVVDDITRTLLMHEKFWFKMLNSKQGQQPTMEIFCQIVRFCYQLLPRLK